MYAYIYIEREVWCIVYHIWRNLIMTARRDVIGMVNLLGNHPLLASASYKGFKAGTNQMQNNGNDIHEKMRFESERSIIRGKRAG